MSDSYLYLFQIAPVQSFIEASRRTQDLFVGSRILSMIAQAGVRSAQAYSVDLLFPATTADNVLPHSVPHRFAFTSHEAPDTIAPAVEIALHQHWELEIAGRVRDWLKSEIGDGAWVDIFDRQIERWLEVYWVAVPYDESDDMAHGTSYTTAVRALAARKQLRHFPQVNEPGIKCTLTGAQSALPLAWDKLEQRLERGRNIVLRANERLGSLATIKRFAQFAGCELGVENDAIQRFPDLETIAKRGLPAARAQAVRNAEDESDVLRVAILHLDGDHMGKTLSLCQTKAQHQALSQALADFSENKVEGIVKESLGELIYAGGDDVLALLPLTTVLACADALRKVLEETTREVITEITEGTRTTGVQASAGIALTSTNLPLDIALKEARVGEKIAKDEEIGFGRNALVVRESHRSGQIRQAGAQWEIAGVELVAFTLNLQLAFQPLAEDEWLSTKIGYDLLELAHDLGFPQGEKENTMREAEVRRLLKRRCGERLDDDQKGQLIDVLAPALVTLGEAENCGWESVANWTILAKFLARGGLR
ncbi:MAG: type III-B CRISPR-associated protein Cas10/Cmr2 [Chloroflexota bacterium]